MDKIFGNPITKAERSRIMSAIKAKDSRIEIRVRKAFWKKGFRYRKNAKSYLGTPDIVLKKYKTVIFIDSCFWHGCKQHGKIPSTRKAYWAKKIENNKKQDRKVNRHYKKIGWKVVRVWEHEIQKNIDELILKIIEKL